MANPSLAMIPSGYKAGKLYSVLPQDGTGDFTVVRNSVATRVNENGVIEEVAANVPRLDYTDGGCPVLNLEPQATNLALWSEDFSNVYYPKSGVGVSINQIFAPDGSLSADELIEDTSISNHLINAASKFADTNQKTLSIYAKANSRSWIRLQTQSPYSSWVNFDLENGVVGLNGGSEDGFEIEKLKDGWYRCSVTYKNTATSGIQIFLLDSDRGGPSPSYEGDGVSSIYIWGAQVEQSSTPTSYIKTQSTTVTRLADVATSPIPVGITEIIETIDGVDQTPITVFGATHEISKGKINKVTMN
jgi:hypothetical protein